MGNYRRCQSTLEHEIARKVFLSFRDARLKLKGSYERLSVIENYSSMTLISFASIAQLSPRKFLIKMQAAGVELNESFPSPLAQRKLFRFMKSKVFVIKVVIETS